MWFIKISRIFNNKTKLNRKTKRKFIIFLHYIVNFTFTLYNFKNKYVQYIINILANIQSSIQIKIMCIKVPIGHWVNFQNSFRITKS